MKIMRSNYDKAHRCPGWSGPAFKGGDNGCPGGGFAVQMGEDDNFKWHGHTCDKCGVYVLPLVLQNLDPSWWKYRLERRWGKIKYWFDTRR